MAKRFFIFVIAAALGLQACGTPGNEVLAVIDGHKITKKEFRLKTGLYGLKTVGEDEIKGFLNLLINDYVILEQAQKDGIKVTQAELDREIGSFVPGFSESEIKKTLKKQGIKYGYWRRDIEEKIIRKKEINFVMKNRIKIEENDLKDFFWTNILEFRKLKQIRARQIVLDSEEKAKEVVKLAREGMDFAALAKKYSTASEAEEGGDMGYFSPGDMPAFINEAVAGLKKGDISTIVKSPYGWHIFRIEDIAEAETPIFEKARAEVLDRYFDMKKDEYFGVWMEDLRKKTDIKINEENLKKFIKEAVL
jgi:foldase protein PrsA